MNPYALERIARQRTGEIRAMRPAAAGHRPAAGGRGRVIRHRAGWALIQIGLALVTSSVPGRRPAVARPDLP